MAAGAVWIVTSGRVSAGALLFFAVLIPSVILHEIAHGVAALAFGDTTARDAGRLSLNPLRHVDPFGTLILPALMVLTMGTAFGYAKPVPVRPGRMRNPRTHSLLVSLAGPATNLVLVGLASVVFVLAAGPDRTEAAYQVLRRLGGFGAVPGLARPSLVATVAFLLGLANVVLAVFNLIPIPPLDGSALVERAIPARYMGQWHAMQRWSMGLFIVLFLALPGFFGRIINPAVELWLRLL